MSEGSRRRLAVLGSPIGHSLSPALHRAAYAELGLDWDYEAIEVTEDGLERFVAGLDEGWRGLSLTMPLKTAVLPLLDHRDELVDLAGAANTVVLDGGRRSGHNTDVPALAGLVRSVWNSGGVVVLGGGATARSTIVGLALAGCSRAVVVSRGTAEELAGTARRVGLELEWAGWDSAAALAAAAALVVSTVPAQVALPLAEAGRPGGALLDVAYDPWPTPLTLAYQEAGRPAATGFELLLAQAVLQVELFTGRAAPEPAMRVAGLTELERR